MSIKTIKAQELFELYKAGKKIDLIDVRTPLEYQEVHVEFAKNIPLSDFVPADLIRDKATTDAPLYLICRSGSRGKQACEKLVAEGFTNVVNIDGGTTACLEAGLPIVNGRKAISLERQVRIAAGTLVVLGAVLSWTITPIFIALSAFVGAGLVFAGVTDTCGLGMVLARMPWNQSSKESSCCSR